MQNSEATVGIIDVKEPETQLPACQGIQPYVTGLNDKCRVLLRRIEPTMIPAKNICSAANAWLATEKQLEAGTQPWSALEGPSPLQIWSNDEIKNPEARLLRRIAPAAVDSPRLRNNDLFCCRLGLGSLPTLSARSLQF